MSLNSSRKLYLITIFLLFLVSVSLIGPISVSAAGPDFVPTFESIGIYWSPSGGSSSNQCQVEYKVLGTSVWKQGYPLWYDASSHTVAGDSYPPQYRGSLVNLQPGTSYDIKLTLTEPPYTSVTGTTTTWSEDFPVVQTFNVSDRNTTLTIDQSGSATNGYLVYDGMKTNGQKAVIDVGKNADHNVIISGSYVVVRNLILINAKADAIEIGVRDRGYENEVINHVVIENNEISEWGGQSNYGCDLKSSGIRTGNNDGYGSLNYRTEQIIVQRNKIFNPGIDSTYWYEDSGHPHPCGPQAVSFFNSRGNHVIRYNHMYSTNGNYFNDILGAGANDSTTGFPSSNSDIYGNILEHCWDDAIESEGGNMNVRIWGNYINYTHVKIAVADTQVGPLYIWRNVTGVSQRNPSWEDSGLKFLKTGSGNGRVYIFHNTFLRTMLGGIDRGIREGITGSINNFVSRNNILDCVRRCVDTSCTTSSDSDYDICNNDRGISCQGSHTLANTGPIYHRYDPYHHEDIITTGQADISLRSDSSGYDYGVVLPNFNDGYTGSLPDVGAHEADTPPMEFGVNAYLGVSPTPTQSPCAGPGDVDCDQDVDTADLRMVLKVWGRNITTREDAHSDGKVNLYDAVVVVGNWAP